MTLQEMLERLKENQGSLVAVSEKLEMNYSTLRHILVGITNEDLVRVQTYEKIYDLYEKTFGERPWE